MKKTSKQTSQQTYFDEMPEIDLSKCKIIRRGPNMDRPVTLAFVREVQKLTQAQLAKRAKTTQSAISHTESCNGILVSTLSHYAKALGGELQIAIKIGEHKLYPIKLK
jgi:hypothetical protein